MTVATQPPVIPLWPAGAPGSEDWTQREQEGVLPAPIGVRAVWNVSRPALTAYLPDPAVATGAPRPLARGVGVANGFGFGGQNASVVFGEAPARA